jgi:methyl coenzyme M reductase gamma subunit
LIGGTEATGHETKAKFQKKIQPNQFHPPLPNLEHAKAAVLNSLNSTGAKSGYRHAIDQFVDWHCSEPRLAFNRSVVLRYRSHLS